MKAVGRPAVQNHGGRSRATGLSALSAWAAWYSPCPFRFCCAFHGVGPAAEKWQGVDETVVEKYSVEHGRPPKLHFIEPTGDVLLFVFLVAGVAGGFIIGYYYRDFIATKKPGGETDEG